jgi:hypothetical protein
MLSTGKIMSSSEDNAAYGLKGAAAPKAPGRFTALFGPMAQRGGGGGGRRRAPGALTSHGGVGGRGAGAHGKYHAADARLRRIARQQGLPEPAKRLPGAQAPLPKGFQASQRRLQSAQDNVARFGVAPQFRAMGVRSHQKPVINKNGKLGWWIKKANGRYGWVSLRPRI